MAEVEFWFRLIRGGYGTPLPFVNPPRYTRHKMAATPLPAPPTEDPRPLRADARRNRERILLAARAAFAERGSEVQMDEIAQHAGVGVGTLYRHFPTKEALVVELVRQSVGGCIASAEQALHREDPWESVEWLVRHNAEEMARDAGMRDAIATVKFEDGCPWEHSELRRHNAALIERAQQAGAMDPGITVDDFRALMCGLSAAIASGGDPERQADILLAGLRAR
jgi:AcrR family transcriptional regulator